MVLDQMLDVADNDLQVAIVMFLARKAEIITIQEAYDLASKYGIAWPYFNFK